MDRWQHKDARLIFEFREITLEETFNILSGLPSSLSYGHNNIDALAFKSSIPNLLRPIQHIVNLSLRESRCAMNGNLQLSLPDLKAKVLTDMTSVCIACLSPTNHLKDSGEDDSETTSDFLETTNQMNPSAHAYRRHLSTTTTLADISDEMYQGTEDNKISSLMAVDQSAAFDCVEVELLLQKLQRYNVGPKARTWIHDYLTQRTQYVKIGTARSCMKEMKTGVPQGSVIGPILYAIMTNDMTETVKDRNCNMIEHQDTTNLFGKQCGRCGILSMYADDSTFTVSSNTRIRNKFLVRRNLDEISILK